MERMSDFLGIDFKTIGSFLKNAKNDLSELEGLRCSKKL